MRAAAYCLVTFGLITVEFSDFIANDPDLQIVVSGVISGLVVECGFAVRKYQRHRRKKRVLEQHPEHREIVEVVNAMD